MNDRLSAMGYERIDALGQRMLVAGETLAEQRDSARSIAVRLEQDTAVLAWLHAEAVWRAEASEAAVAREWRRRARSAIAERDDLAAGMLGDSYERAELLAERDRLAGQVAAVRELTMRMAGTTPGRHRRRALELLVGHLLRALDAES